MKWSVIYFPYPAQEHFGTNGRVNVNVVIDVHQFDGVLLPSRNGHYLVYNAAMKKLVKKVLGDAVQVGLERCAEKRELVVPEYISAVLKDGAAFEKFLEMPDYIKREEINKIESAQRDETKSKRLQALVERLAR
jgi:uncharacterized protein YdeI (YjbR/CyaY-like superfamily)